jgi:hypothetical protein
MHRVIRSVCLTLLHAYVISTFSYVLLQRNSSLNLERHLTVSQVVRLLTL